MGGDYEKRIGGFSPSPLFRIGTTLSLCFSVFFFPWKVTFAGILIVLFIVSRPYEIFIPAFLIDILYGVATPLWFDARFVFVFFVIVAFIAVEFLKQRIRFYHTP